MFFLPKSGKIFLSTNQKVIPKEEWAEWMSFQDLLKKGQEELLQQKKEMEELTEQERARGYEEGFKEGMATWQEHTLLFEKKLKELYTEAQNKVLPLALKAAKKIVAAELALEPERILDIIREALGGVLGCKLVKLFVRKEDLALVEEKKSELRSLFEHLDFFSIEVKENLDVGCCAIETERGMVNSSVPIKLAAIEEIFERFGMKS